MVFGKRERDARKKILKFRSTTSSSAILRNGVLKKENAMPKRRFWSSAARRKKPTGLGRKNVPSTAARAREDRWNTVKYWIEVLVGATGILDYAHRVVPSSPRWSSSGTVILGLPFHGVVPPSREFSQISRCAERQRGRKGAR